MTERERQIMELLRQDPMLSQGEIEIGRAHV